MDRIDDADPASGETAMNSLRILQIRIHSCRAIHKPGAQMIGGVLCIAAVVRYLPRRRQGRHLHAQTHQCTAMIVEIVGVRHSVTLDVWTTRILWVRPPVVAFRKEIVSAAGASF